MVRFWRGFGGWLAVLMAFFVLANVAGVVRPQGLLPFRSAGFPFTVAEWGMGVEEFFDWSALTANVAVAVYVSGVVACGCAWARSRVAAVPAPRPDGEP